MLRNAIPALALAAARASEPGETVALSRFRWDTPPVAVDRIEPWALVAIDDADDLVCEPHLSVLPSF